MNMPLGVGIVSLRIVLAKSNRVRTIDLLPVATKGPFSPVVAALARATGVISGHLANPNTMGDDTRHNRTSVARVHCHTGYTGPRNTIYTAAGSPDTPGVRALVPIIWISIKLAHPTERPVGYT